MSKKTDKDAAPAARVVKIGDNVGKDKNVNQEHLDLLGKTGKDRVTGFVGVISSISFDLYGCVQVVLCPPLDKDGKMQDGRWFDANRIEITNHERCMPVPQFAARPQEHMHGPAEKPERR